MSNSSEIYIVPEQFYELDQSHLVRLVADMLTRLIEHNDRIPWKPDSITRFHSRSPPGISVHDYLQRIVKYTPVERAVLIVILIYIDRVCAKHPNFIISSLTLHRYLITAVTVGSKALCDSYCTNSHYAKVGGVSTMELNLLELEFTFYMEWDLIVSGEVIQTYYTNLVREHPSYQFSSSDTPTVSDHSIDDSSDYQINNNTATTFIN
ncbi:cyclin-domain-containing protein [Conidiobolus coronatus NRRL 28638]|uniref:Cyclin n=1 Tax=Conidiobolus coronatus (strain ATCC 28846 / CBS 209.66 / NRRL 28638) TaxID=796925 RepID=A0A137P7Y4_CONC2|nr:cyclin-domain-containing protein [Conidiobolus coronatus NRRL 28638]|eukprot:KXN71116.1 cyclin-domain-containing protein [Conidiobolus coronatus NRRL 28638]